MDIILEYSGVDNIRHERRKVQSGKRLEKDQKEDACDRQLEWKQEAIELDHEWLAPRLIRST
jgi:hypothetical protein